MARSLDFDGDLEDYSELAREARHGRRRHRGCAQTRCRREKCGKRRRERGLAQGQRAEASGDQVHRDIAGQARDRSAPSLRSRACRSSTTARDAAHARKVTERHAAVVREIEHSETRWLELSERLESHGWLTGPKSRSSMRPPPVPRRKRRLGRLFAYGFLALWLLVALWNLYKPLPDGMSVRGPIVETPLHQLQFLTDVTGADAFGAPVVRQQIFDAVLKIIGEAQRISGARLLPVQQPARRAARQQAAP